MVKPNPPQIIKKLKRSVIQEFERLEDPRIKREPKHLLIDIVAIVIIATLSGADNVVMIKRERQLWNKRTTEVCFYITSLEPDAVVLAQAIRAHWGVENS